MIFTDSVTDPVVTKTVSKNNVSAENVTAASLPVIKELFRQEIELAKAEAKQSATRAGKGVGMFGGAVTRQTVSTFSGGKLAEFPF